MTCADMIANIPIHSDLIATHRSRVRALARSLVPYSPGHWEDLEQAGMVGLLSALEKYDPTRPNAFWTYAWRIVRNSMVAYLAVGVYWRKESNRGGSPERRAARTRARESMIHVQLDSEMSQTDEASPEEIVGWLEVHRRVQEYLSERGITLDERSKIGPLAQQIREDLKICPIT